MDDRSKWKLINKLTNLQTNSGVQPIRMVRNGKPVYLFEDDEIQEVTENHHIRKVDHSGPRNPDDKCEVLTALQEMVTNAMLVSSNDVMNSLISDYEIKLTFGTGSDTAGPDGITASLIDKANRVEMQQCLSLLWNKAWTEGYFINVWKEEDRVIIPKPGKDDYHDCDSYRTVSITSCLGKRFERITAQRLIAVLEQVNFDPLQFAYLHDRSCTQALQVLVERVKNSLIAGNIAGVVFFYFSDAFGSVDRNLLLLKLGRDFGITGRLFLHIHSFLSHRFARIRTNGMLGDWIKSLFGTSAGTILGPLLFVSYIHDVPRCVS